MSYQFSTACRNAAAEAIEANISTGAVLKIRSGTVPASVAASDSGTVIATLTLPTDWLGPASNGTKSKAGTWEDLTADTQGIAGHFRIYASDGSTCHWQGPVVEGSASDGEMALDNTDINAGQAVTVTAFSLTIGGA